MKIPNSTSSSMTPARGFFPTRQNRCSIAFVKFDNFSWGSRLGLPICRLLTEKMGGSISIDASYREGLKLDIILHVS